MGGMSRCVRCIAVRKSALKPRGGKLLAGKLESSQSRVAKMEAGEYGKKRRGFSPPPGWEKLYPKTRP
jgi:hypothetical protein